MNTLITEPSICIPRTLHNVTWVKVKDAFEQVIGKGTVSRVDIVPSKTNDSAPFCRIFVHFRYWPNSPEIMAVRQRLLDGEMIKVVYDTPWFWKCSASRIPRPERNNLHKTPPYIECSPIITPPPNIVRQSAFHQLSDPVSDPVSDLVSDPVSDPVSVPVSHPVSDSVSDPVSDS